MATALQNLETARDNVAEKIAEISANPKPSYSIDGQSVSWNEYHKMLIDLLKMYQEAIAVLDPFIIKSQVL